MPPLECDDSTFIASFLFWRFRHRIVELLAQQASATWDLAAARLALNEGGGLVPGRREAGSCSLVFSESSG
jgi:hypothetical protein